MAITKIRNGFAKINAKFNIKKVWNDFVINTLSPEGQEPLSAKAYVGTVMIKFPLTVCMGLLPDAQNCGLRLHRECRERFPRHRGLAILTCITARAWSTCRDARRDR